MSSSPTQNGWNHHPPSSMPWGMYPQTGVTRFSGERVIDCKKESANLQISLWNPEVNWEESSIGWNLSSKHLKRKLEDVSDGQSRKQLITEEKISAHLSQLSLTSSASAPSQEQTQPELMEEKPSSSDSQIKISANSTLVLSDEIRRYHQEPCIPTSLLEQHLNKPCMAVVLWQPPLNAVDRLASMRAQRVASARSNELLREQEDISIDVIDDSNNNEPINNYNFGRMRTDEMETDEIL